VNTKRFLIPLILVAAVVLATLLVPILPSPAVLAQGPQPPVSSLRQGTAGGVTAPEAATTSGEISAASLPVIASAEPVPSTVVHDPSGFQNEGSVAVSPCDPDVLVTTYNRAIRSLPDYPRDFDAVISRSLDGGKTWTELEVPGFPARTYDESQGNSNIAFGAAPGCRLFFSTMSFARQSGSHWGGIYVSTSDNLGESWTLHVIDQETSSFIVDKPWLATGPAGKATVCWDRVYDTLSYFYCSQSADSGQTWTAPFRLDANPPRVWAVGIHPSYGSDGTLYVTGYNTDAEDHNATVFYRQEGDGTFTRRIVAEQTGNFYKLGMLASVVEADDINHTLHLTWGNGTTIWEVSSTDKGNNWMAQQTLASASGLRFPKPYLCEDTLGQPVIQTYVYNVAANTLQAHVGLVGGSGFYPTGPQFTLVGGNLDNWDAQREAMGDNDACGSNQNPDWPGVVLGFTVERPTQSTPPGYISGADNDVHFAEATTVPRPEVKTTTVFRNDQVVLASLPVLNSGLVSGQQFQFMAATTPPNCPVVEGLPSPQITIPARQVGNLPFSIDFESFTISERYCDYVVSVGGGNMQVVTGTLHVWMGEVFYLPLLTKNSQQQ
jgi:hypothetical protein